MLLRFFAFSILLGLGISSVEGFCGQALTGKTGIITSPNWPRNYYNRAFCRWTITSDPGTVIELTFFDLDIEYQSTCRYDSLSIHDGISAGTPQVARLCGRRNVPPITSTGNELYLFFRTDGSVTRRGFRLKWTAVTPDTECSEVLNANQGWIESPNFPRNYPGRTKCEWIIRSDANTEITLTFPAFDLPDSRLCTGDAVIVRDGPTKDANLLARICGTENIPAFVRSSSNVMYVKFRSDRTHQRMGFRAEWSTTQDAVEALTGNTGTFKSPNYPDDYPNFAWHAWTITTDTGTQVVLSFEDFEIQGGDDCSNDYLVVRDGSDRTGNLLLKDCGFIAPAPIISTGNVIYIEFRSDDRKTHAGFKAKWSTSHDCFYALTGTSGTIQSPNYPSNYTNNDQCVWTITTDPGYIIRLDVQAVDLQESYKCRSDFLTVRDGNNQFGTKLDTLCGDTIPLPIYSRGNEMFAFFHTDASVTGTGLTADWTVIPDCSGDLNGNEGWIQSPNYPLNYYNKAQCVWVIRSDPGTQITLTFSAFDLPSSSQCSGDAVIVRDGDSSSSDLLARLCSSPGFVRSTNNVMYVKFRSGKTATATGFRAKWSTTDDPAVALTGNTGTLQSQNYPNNYPNFAWQAWKITADSGTQVTVSFVDFEMQGGDDCSFDYVVVHDGADKTANLLLKDCGRVAPAPVTSTGNVIYIEFRADEKKTDAGFKAEWSTSPGCIQYLSGSSGTLQTPNYPGNYPSTTQCVWVITVDPAEQVKLTIPSVVLQYDDECRDDFLVIRDGGDQFAPQLNKLCGDLNPPPIISRGNQMFIFFHTDDSVTGTGFSGSWTAIPGCSQELTGTGGWIETPNYPANYYDRARCEWVLRTDLGTQIQLEFTSFLLPVSFVCRSDAVFIYDGEDRSAKLLGRLCGAGHPPNMYISTGNAMTVRFRSDSAVTTQGFRAKWGVSEECSGELNGNEGYVQSPNHPGLYPNSVICEWVIRSDAGTRVTLNFLKNYLPKRSIPTNADSVTIRDGDSSTSPLLATIFSGGHTPSIRASGNVMYVRFYSNVLGSTEGFRAFWHTREPCEYTLTGIAGTIQSPDYPSDYPINSQCTWQINTNPGTNIVLTFTDFDVQYHWDCRSDRLSIFDGPNPSSRVLHRACGNELPQNIIGSTESLFLRFNSDETGSGRGFKASWTTFGGCSETFNANSGTISSPNYPGNYFKNAMCEWVIRSDPGTQITLIFSDFEIQGSYYCNSDAVIIRDGDSAAGDLLGRYCLAQDVVPLTSSGNEMYVSFRSSSNSFTRGGFRAHWSTAPACVYDVTGNSGTIQSPYYPNNYTNIAQCMWKISTSPGSQIVLDFLTFDVEQSPSCGDDSLAIHDGEDQYATRLEFLCGSQLPRSVISTGNHLFLYFSTNEVGTATGFQAEWSIFQGCNANLQGNTGTIQSPNYPGNYQGNAMCEWVIRSDAGTDITLSFNDFDIVRSSNCAYDALYIHDGEDQTAELLATMCGTGDAVPVTSTNNVMYVMFNSSATYHAKGFQASWSTDQGCLFRLTGNTGTIQSPDNPGNYPNNTQCSWLITTDEDTQAVLTFTEFDLQYSMGCEADAVTVYQILGSSDSLPMSLERRCGSTAPAAIRSASNMLYVTFTSDHTVTSTGFKADWSIYQGCGETLTGDNGTIQSPNYPNNYPNNEFCRWSITTDSGTRVKLEFVRFELEGSGGCVFDSLSIIDNGESKLCGVRLPNPYTAVGNTVALKFKTDGSVTDQGFEIRWSAMEWP